MAYIERKKEMSFKKYRFIDLTSLIIIGVITEALGVYFSIQAIPWYNPYSIVSLALISLAITRHNTYGAITIPIFAATNIITYILTYKFGLSETTVTNHASYYVLRSVCCLLTLTSPIILLRFYKNGTNIYLESIGKVFNLSFIISLISLGIDIVFTLLTSIIYVKGSISGSGILFSLIYAVEYCAIGIIFLFLLSFIMYKMNIFKNCYEYFVELEREKKNEYEYYNVISKELESENEDSQKKGM